MQCEDDYELLGNSVAVCEYIGDYTYWAWGNDPPMCVPEGI